MAAETIDQDLIPGEIGCRRLTADDYDLMMDLVLNHFFPREPLCSTMERHFPGEISAFIKDGYVKNCIRDNASLIAYDKRTGEDVGIILGSLYRVNKDKEQKPLSELSPLVRMLDSLNEDIGSHVGDSLYLCVAASTVKQTYCQKGIMTKIRKRLELVAKELKCGYITSESSSMYTQRITKNLGYTETNEILFADYVDPVTGGYVVKDADPPHDRVKLMIKKIE
uniref:aralkylamine N-acetyltransferase n=1 Tax=Ciona savignyi TaxID=51511 RepID=H2Z514_CIOSA